MHASRAPHPMDYTPQILTVMTWCMTVSKWVSLITAISSRCLPYICTQEGVSPWIPSNLMTSQHPRGICVHSLTLISQSAISLSLGHAPCRLHKPLDPLCFLHSDSDQQKDNTNHTQPLASSVCSQQDTVNHTWFSMCHHLRHPR